MQKLCHLKVGQSAVIKGFEDEELGLVLSEMGLFVGEQIELSGTAPLGDPLCIRSLECMISLRKKEAASVLVEIS